jgi:hypothetical protein
MIIAVRKYHHFNNIAVVTLTPAVAAVAALTGVAVL